MNDITVVRIKEERELDTMNDNEMVAYWNVLQFSNRTILVDPDGKVPRHIAILDALLTKRNIPHQKGKLINKN